MAQLDFTPREDLSYIDGFNLHGVYYALPNYLKDLLRHHHAPQDLFIALYSCIITLAALIPNVYIQYGGRKTYPFLYLMVILPPAGGKGVLGLSRLLLADINRKLTQDFEESNKRYEQEMLNYKRNAGKPGASAKSPNPPKMPQILLSGNITNARLIQQLSENGDRLACIINETEADILSALLGSEMGAQNSGTFRQVYHQEPTSASRKGNNRETLIAPLPKMGILLAGTENQIQNLFKGGNQDGLFSRFTFLEPEGKLDWASMRPKAGEEPIEEYYQRHGQKSAQLWEQTKNLDLEVRLTNAQWDNLDKFGEEMQRQAHLEGGTYAISVARRHALMLVRFCTVIAVFRHIDPDTCKVPPLKGQLTPSDEDFWVSLELTRYSFRKAMAIFKRMPSPAHIRITNARQAGFYIALPLEFTTTEANLLAENRKIPARTRDRWLKEFVETKALERVDRGHYRKCHVAQMAVAEEEDNF
jgi:hypothetical protein